jgi:hypothetical protein
VKRFLARGLLALAAAFAVVTVAPAQPAAAAPTCDYLVNIESTGNGSGYLSMNNTGVTRIEGVSTCWVRITVRYQILGSSSVRYAFSYQGYDNYGRFWTDGAELGRAGSSVQISTFPGPEFIIKRHWTKIDVYNGSSLNESCTLRVAGISYCGR